MQKEISHIGSELEHVKQKKKHIVAVRMIGRQISLMTAQVIHICPNDYSDVKTVIFILPRFNLVGQVSFSWQPARHCYSIDCDLV